MKDGQLFTQGTTQEMIKKMYWMNYTKWTYGFVRLKAADSVFISKTNIRREEMKKLVVGILILASFGLAACGNSNNTSQADTKKAAHKLKLH